MDEIYSRKADSKINVSWNNLHLKTAAQFAHNSDIFF